MLPLLREAGLVRTPDLDTALAIAWRLHRALNPKEPEQASVNRSVLLQATTSLNPSIVKVLTLAGLDIETWRKSVGLSMAVDENALEPAPSEFRVTDGVRGAITAWARHHASKPFDATALAGALVAYANGEFAALLKAAGLNISDAAAALEKLVFVNVTDGPWPIPMTDAVYFILTKARELTHRVGPNVPLTTSVVLIACVERPSEIPEFLLLRDQLRERASEGLSETISSWLAWYSSAPGLLDVPTDALFEALNRAHGLAAEASKAKEIAPRHLVAALLTPPEPTGAIDFLRSLNIGEKSIARAVFDFIEKCVERGVYADDLAVWRARLLGATSPVERRTRAPRFRVAEFTTDLLEGPDLLQFQREVDAFATLIASKNLKPPLSIGVFGDWGSGKSFFMRQLRKSIDQLARDVTAAEKTGRTPDMHGRIVQIEFNAWHYVESNLWASLVEHIFQNLKLSGETEDDSKRRQRQLLEQLDSALAKQIEAAAHLARAESDHQMAAKQVEIEKSMTETATATLTRLHQVDVWETVQIGDQEKHQLSTALHALGITRAIQSARQVRDVISEVQGIANRSKLLWSWMVQGPGAPQRLAVFAIVMLVPLALTIFLPSLLARIGTFDPFATRVIELATLAGGVATWLSAQVKKGRAFLAKLDDARSAIDAKIEAAEKIRRAEIERISDKQKAAEANLATAVEALQTADTNVRNAQRDLADNAPDRQLARFIEQRVASEDYRKLLGILAMVRGDFDKLSTLMDTGSGRRATDTFHIDRIVLYIDDLDRCPPARVVEVLQAVHLLLAYKLFVVVVGVDARWVSRSLERQYRHVLQTPRSLSPRGNVVPGFQVTPNDYLEKIFQVPFWIQPMTPEAASAFLSGVVEVQRDHETVVAETAATGAATFTPMMDSPAHPVRASPDEQLPDPRPADQSPSDVAPGEDRLNPVLVQLQQKELDAMKSLAPLVGRSPRTVKRFVNVYRIIRASQTAAQLDEFLSDDDGSSPYQSLLLLLGVITGTPAVSIEFLQRVRDAEANRPVNELVEELLEMSSGWAPSKSAEWTRAVSALRKFGEGSTATVARLQTNLATVSRFSFRQARF